MRQAVRPESTTIKAESSAPFNRLCHNYLSGFNCSNQQSHFSIARLGLKGLLLGLDLLKQLGELKRNISKPIKFQFENRNLNNQDLMKF